MPSTPPRPPLPTRQRTQLESFLVLRRNPLELWGRPAYEEDILPGKFLGARQLMVNAPEAIRHVLVTNAENYVRNVAARRVLQPVLGDGLFLAEGESWRHQRRTIAPALAPRTMPILARHVVAATQAAEATLDALTHRPVELLPHMQHLALAIAGQSMFSLEMRDFTDELRAMLLGYARQYAQPGLLDLLLPRQFASTQDRGRARFRTQWIAFLDRLIAARASLESDPDRPRDLFDLLSQARDPESGAGFDHAQLRDEVATMILAGHETTAVTLFWALYLAALYPEQQRVLAEEAQAADLGEEAAAMAKLPRLRAHIDESLRLYPPAFLIVRQAVASDEIAGQKVEAGTVITISPWVIHRHHKRWKNPDAFDPSRFLPGAPAPERYAYMPFGAGPRICVGAQFALTEATLVLARLLARFHIEIAGTGEVLPRGIVTTQPDRPVRFVVSRRSPVVGGAFRRPTADDRNPVSVETLAS
jgi:unspecific monooxygenase